MELQKRKANRLDGYDYSQSGIYFITICVEDKKCLLSQIKVGEGLALPEIKLSAFGKIAKQQLIDLEKRYNNVKIENYVIMPNHIHVLLRLNSTGGASPSPTIFRIIGAYKSLTTMECKKILPIDKLFQRSYYDHIIRDDEDYQKIYNYIKENPIKWTEDKYYES